MQCPICKSDKLICTDSRALGGATRRRRECRVCGQRFTSIEIPLLEYKQLKGREAFLDDILRREGAEAVSSPPF